MSCCLETLKLTSQWSLNVPPAVTLRIGPNNEFVLHMTVTINTDYFPKQPK